MKLEYVHEFKLRYMGGFFRYQEHSRAEKQWARFSDFHHDLGDFHSHDVKAKQNMNCKVLDPADKKWKPKVVDIGKVVLDFSFPELGYVNMQYGIRYLERMPYRQWNRLLRGSVVNADVYSGVVDIIPSKELGSSWETHAEQVLTGQYMTFKEAVQSIVNGDRLASAFAKDYAVTLAPQNRKKLWVLLKNGPIGVVDEVDGEYVIAVPQSMEYVVEDLMQYADTAIYF